MKLGFIGLGRMGTNMVLNALGKGHKIVAYNRSEAAIREVEKKGAIAALTLENLISELLQPRVVWLMVPAGNPVDTMIDKLIPLLDDGDLIIDGGNSHYKDSQRHGELLKKHKINFLDVGTSGGIDGARNGACMMIGGDKTSFDQYKSLFRDFCVPDGYGYVGNYGAGHYVKMVHNGIEYGMMQALGEGFELLDSSSYDLDLAKVGKIYANGSVIRSWLMDLALAALNENPSLSEFSGPVKDSGEGKWTIQSGLDNDVPLPAISAAVFERFRSRTDDSLTDRMVSAMREGFGRHISGSKK
jgi:6-phosphogluconate dehydrogenase